MDTGTDVSRVDDDPDGTPQQRSPGSSGTRSVTGARLLLAVIVALTGATMLLGYANKARCIGPTYDEAGRTTPDYTIRVNRDACYSDIQYLWLGRDVEKHVFPYVGGSITPEGKLQGGTVEYPVLTGLLIWAGAILADNDGQYLLGSALLMAPFGLVTGWMLGRLSRWRALLWALGPPLVLYAFHNWDLPVVACAVGAIYAMHGWRTHRPLADRATVAAALLGAGFAFKVYPGAFLLPLTLYVLVTATPGRWDWRAALRVPVTGAAVVVLANLPFALAGYEGWRASFTFQQLRKVDDTTNSIWFWGLRHLVETTDDAAFQQLMDRVSPTLVLISFAVAAAVGWWRWHRSGDYPWIGVSAAMLCGFLLLHKVHSPQYTLWLLPFFVLLAVPWRWIVSYLVVDVVMGIGIFRWYYVKETTNLGIVDALATQAVPVGVWGRAALLVVLFVVFLTVPTRIVDRQVRALPDVADTADGHPRPRLGSIRG